MAEYNYTKRVEQRFLCGCHIDEMIDGSYGITYCNKHKAAPSLYEALKIILHQYRLVRPQIFGTDEYEDVAHEALAMAEGKE